MDWFTDSAMAKLLQSLPELSPYIQTFNDMSDQIQDESDIRVGVFILNFGAKFAFIPVIAKGQTIFPIDSIFDQGYGRFIPITKATIQDLVSSSQGAMGQAKEMPRTMPVNPNLQEMISPPRTGKVAYASSSGRLVEFLATLPDALKGHIKDKFTADADILKGLHKFFDVEEVLKALKTSNAIAESAEEVAIITAGADLSPDEISDILTKGYSVRGAVVNPRFALRREDLRQSFRTTLTTEAGGYAADVMDRTGNIRQGFVPTVSTVDVGGSKDPVIFFPDGTWDYGRSISVCGEKAFDNSAPFETLLANCPPILPRTISADMTFAIFDSAAKLIGVFKADGVTRSSYMDTITASRAIDHTRVVIKASRNVQAPIWPAENEIWIPSYSTIIPIKGHRSTCTDVSSAARMLSSKQLQLLTSEINLGYDGVEFSINGKPIGDKPKVAHELVVKQHFDPVTAENFIKQAEKDKRITICMSKEAADTEQYGESVAQPEFANKRAPGSNISELGGEAIQNMNAAMSTQDPQAVEATILAELLQSPDAVEHIAEYLPEIEECLDKLGRILLLCRVHIDKLNTKISADTIFSMTSNLRTVYRILGDSYVKLKQLVAVGVDNGVQA